MRSFLLVFALLSSCHAAPAFAKVMPGIWDGSCITIDTTRYQHQNSKTENPYMKGYIPPNLDDTKTDISSCFPPAYGMGSH